MEAIGFIASIGQLAATGLAISKTLYEYSSTYTNAPKLLTNLAQDVSLTSSVLEHLSEIFTEARVRAFVRPGALHTAQDAITGCRDIFGEMKVLIDESQAGLGPLIFPFKESKIQLLNARLASLKGTLQLLLQVLQYSSTVNIDPNASQFSLNGTWVMEQFKLLIEEREEAKRNFEQLKAEIGSTKSIPGEAAKENETGMTMLAVVNETGASTSQDVSFSANAVPPKESKDLPTPANSKPEEKSPAKPNPGLRQNNAVSHESNALHSIESILTSTLHVCLAVLCCPCYYIWRRRQASYAQALPPPDLHYPRIPAEEIRNLQVYGPQGVFELTSDIRPVELAAPAELAAYNAQLR